MNDSIEELVRTALDGLVYEEAIGIREDRSREG